VLNCPYSTGSKVSAVPSGMVLAVPSVSNILLLVVSTVRTEVGVGNSWKPSVNIQTRVL
jgi:hypothetical protein